MKAGLVRKEIPYHEHIAHNGKTSNNTEQFSINHRRPINIFLTVVLEKYSPLLLHNKVECVHIGLQA